MIVSVLVNDEGSVARALIAKRAPADLGFDFNGAALEAARNARFAPATRNGVAGWMWVPLPYRFN